MFTRANCHDVLRAALIVLALWSGSCADRRRSGAEPAAETPVPKRPALSPAALSDMQARDYPGIHNAVAFSEGFISGSVPEGDAGFETLAGLGVKTIISVDGAEPDVARAQARGMRYIHLPIGYNGFDEQRKLQLVRATRDAMREGPVYIHCHHGKHRSAGAAATIAASLGWLTPAEGVERMRVSGTAPHYRGLYACAGGATVLAASVVDDVPADFPSVWKPSGFVKGMIEIDEVYERLKLIEKAGWAPPANHPDLVPAAEAGRLADLYRVLAGSDYSRNRPAEFATHMRASGAEAQTLEDFLLGVTKNEALSEQFKQIGTSCKNCHVSYRD